VYQFEYYGMINDLHFDYFGLNSMYALVTSVKKNIGKIWLCEFDLNLNTILEKCTISTVK